MLRVRRARLRLSRVRAVTQWSVSRCPAEPREKDKPTSGERELSPTSVSLQARASLGCASPLLSWRHIVGSDLVQLPASVERLLRTNHPIRRRTRNASESLGPLAALQTDGLTLLLLSKALNTLLEPEHSCHHKVDEFGILPSQRILAEVTEMIQIAFLVHSGVVNTESTAGGDGGNRAGRVATPGSDTELENTMLVLGGDFLLARASKGLARLMNTQVVGMMSRAFAGMMDGMFLQLHLEAEAHNGCRTREVGRIDSMHKNNGSFTLRDILVSEPEVAEVVKAPVLLECDDNPSSYSHRDENEEVSKWIGAVYLQHGSLLAKSCRCSAILAHLPPDSQEMAFSLAQDVSMVRSISRVHPHMPEALSTRRRKELQNVYSSRALQTLKSLPDSHARAMLLELLTSLTM